MLRGDVLAKLGAGALCSWPTNEQLVVKWSAGASVVAGNLLFIRNKVSAAHGEVATS